MEKNVASWDRVARLVSGTVLLALAFFGPQTIWGLLGLIPLLAGITGVCPLYAMLGLSTCGSSSPPRHRRRVGHQVQRAVSRHS
jgi:hypothetical protein